MARGRGAGGAGREGAGGARGSIPRRPKKAFAVACRRANIGTTACMGPGRVPARRSGLSERWRAFASGAERARLPAALVVRFGKAEINTRVLTTRKMTRLRSTAVGAAVELCSHRQETRLELSRK